MAESRQTDEHARVQAQPPQADAPTKLKRRGIIAGAAALAAAALATRSAQPVGASQIIGTGATYTGPLDSNTYDGLQGYASNGPNNSPIAAGVFGRNNDLNGVGVMGVAPSGVGVSGTSTTGPGLSGSSSSNVGVYGSSTNNVGVYGITTSASGYGVQGTNTGGPGVYGSSGTGNGVHGSTTSGNGVYGVNNNTGPGGNGVYGQSTNSTGVAGISSGLYGVYGQSTYSNGVVGSSTNNVGVYGSTGSASSYGVFGVNTDGTGVCGTSTNGTGVNGSSINLWGVSGYSTNFHGTLGTTSKVGAAGIFGWTNLSNVWAGYFVGPIAASSSDNHGIQGTSNTLHGVIGTTYGPAIGVLGQANAAGGVGVVGTASGAAPFAGYFNGSVVVTGNLTVAGSNWKSAAVPHPDGTHRLLYCVESPESWFEDVGQANLVAGKATVTFDPDFAAIVLTANYHVFLTPYGDSNGLYVTSKSATGFVVQEQHGGTSSLTFSWKVMAKRKDITGDRLAKFDLPTSPTPVQPPTLDPKLVPKGATVPTFPKITPNGTATPAANPSVPASPSASAGTGTATARTSPTATAGSETPAPANGRTGTPGSTTTAEPSSTKPGTATGTSATPNPAPTVRR